MSLTAPIATLLSGWQASEAILAHSAPTAGALVNHKNIAARLVKAQTTDDIDAAILLPCPRKHSLPATGSEREQPIRAGALYHPFAPLCLAPAARR
jgi:hypothetical protein